MRIRSLIWVLLLVLLTGALNFPAPIVDAAPSVQDPYPWAEDDSDWRYFQASGFYVEGPFLEFYETRGGLSVFGYPKTIVFLDQNTGLYVQYFDNARMEWHPYNPDPYKVQLGLLGEELGHREPPLAQSEWQPSSRFRRTFTQTGHIVSFAFLDFYDNHGGLDVFGYPISEPMLDEERGFIVQYFQRMRMEWNPERPRDERVVIGELGDEYIYQIGVPEYVLDPSSDNRHGDVIITGAPSSSLRISAAVRLAITGREGSQTVFVYVTDAARQPVEGALVSILVHYPSTTEPYYPPVTDAQGLTHIDFEINSPPPGRRVVIDVTVVHEGAQGTAQTFFLPWW
jgi:hypothetical protein